MKPISIKFQCFGPYLDLQEIDFTQFEEQGLFLICGETGSGKTTILEAMSYALYGKSTADPTGNDNDSDRKPGNSSKIGGSYRGELWTMRHENAPEEMDTVVEYIFSIGGEQYLFHRSLRTIKSRSSSEKKKNGDKYKETIYCRHRKDGQWVPFPDVKDLKKDVNRKARELIGLNHVQFCQVIILPQGKFETLLTSNSEDKEKLLEQIFRAGRWKKVTKKLDDYVKEQESILVAKYKQIENKLKLYGCTLPEELRQKLQTQSDMVLQAKEKEDLENALLKEINRRVDDAIKLDEKFRDKEAVEKKLFTLERDKALIQKEKDILSIATAAERLRDPFSFYQKKKEERQTVLGTLRGAELSYDREMENQHSTKEKRARHNSRLEQIDRKKETLKQYEERTSVYQSLAAKKQKVEEDSKLLQKAEKDLQKAKKTLTQQKEKLDLAQGQYDCLLAENKRLWNLYIGGIAYELAQKLEDGAQCPVCGSIHHPHPADPLEEQIAKTALEHHDQTLEEGSERVKACKTSLTDAEANHKDKEIAFHQAEDRLNNSTADYEQAQDKCIPGIPDLPALEGEIEKLRKDLDAYQEEEKALTKEEGRIEQALHIADENLTAARKASEEAEKGWQEILSNWEHLRLQAGFDTDADYDNATMDPEEKDEKQKKVIAYEQELKTLTEDLESKCRELEATEKPDVDAIRKERDCKQTEYARRKSEHDDCRKLREQMDQDLLAIEEAYEVYEEDSVKVKNLSNFVDGLIGSRGIGLQRYVLGVMLDAITDEANHILRTVYDGRYRLYRTDESTGRVHKRGLELGVYSNGNAEGRPASSLSGGEKFLVSLCLAIGLSVVVQAQGCGDRMEALFVDEGFGSLDQNRIGDAITILNHIKGSSGLVGIISHVEALAGHIPAKLKIRKTENGSQFHIQF